MSEMIDLARKLAEALREVLAADPDLPSYSETMDAAELVLRARLDAFKSIDPNQ